MSFHYSIGHFLNEEGHYQDTLQQCQAQHPKQCTHGSLLGSPGRALASRGPQNQQFTC
jgi:hypothetical protein